MIYVEMIRVEIGNLGHITNSYVVYDDEKNAALFDPGDEAEKIINFIDSKKLKVKYIFITHVHADHITALEKIQDYCKANIVVNKEDFGKFYSRKDSCADILDTKLPNINEAEVKFAKENDIINLGEMSFKIIESSGHTSGSICIFEENINAMFTGDTIFSNSYGRCDLPTSSFDNMKKTLNKIFKNYKEDVTIYPGHGNISNLGEAKKKISLLMALRRK